MRKPIDSTVRRFRLLQTMSERELSQHERKIRLINARSEELAAERRRILDDGSKLREAGLQGFIRSCSEPGKRMTAAVIQRAGRFARCCVLGGDISAASARAITSEIQRMSALRDRELSASARRRAAIDLCEAKTRAIARRHRRKSEALEEAELEDTASCRGVVLL